MNHRKWRAAQGALLGALLFFGNAWASPPTPSYQTLPDPTGGHRIGTRKFVFRDANREERLTEDSDDRRELLVQLWYPVESAVPGATEPYMQAKSGDAWAKEQNLPERFYERIGTHAYLNAPVLAGNGPLPTIVFSHGLSFPASNYQSLIEELASHGFVVAAVTHTYYSTMTVFPDGREFPWSMELPEKATQEELFKELAKHVPTWVQDIRFTLDELEKINQDKSNPFYQKLDLARVGVYGHSFGSAAAAKAMNDELRIVAGVGMEGAQYDAPTRPLRVKKPFLFMVAKRNRDWLSGGAQFQTDKSVFYDLIIGGTIHVSFSDLVYVFKPNASQRWLKRRQFDIEPLRTIRIINMYALAFFEKHLQGKDRTLLSADATTFPEAELVVTDSN